MHNGVNSGSSVNVTVFEPDVQTAFVGNFRRDSFFFAKGKVIIDRTVKIGYQ
jgi:hypothetical protein